MKDLSEAQKKIKLYIETTKDKNKREDPKKRKETNHKCLSQINREKERKTE